MDVIVEAHHVNREVLAGIVGVGRSLVAIERGGFGPDLVDEFACCHLTSPCMSVLLFAYS